MGCKPMKGGVALKWIRLLMPVAFIGILLAIPIGCARAEGDESQRMLLPYSLKSIESSAFEKTAAREVYLPAGVTRIGYRAFANMSALEAVYLPPAAAYIDESAFASDDRLVIYGIPGSEAEDWAAKHSVPFVSKDIWGITEDRSANPDTSEPASDVLTDEPSTDDTLMPVFGMALKALSVDPKEKPEYYPIDYDFP